MIIVVIKESPHNPDVSQKRFLCPHCGKLIIYYTIMPIACRGAQCQELLPNVRALMQMPSARISWHKGTTSLLCSP